MKTTNHTKKFLVRHRHPLAERIEIAEIMKRDVDHTWHNSPPVNIQQAVDGANMFRDLDYEVEITEIER